MYECHEWLLSVEDDDSFVGIRHNVKLTKAAGSDNIVAGHKLTICAHPLLYCI